MTLPWSLQLSKWFSRAAIYLGCKTHTTVHSLRTESCWRSHVSSAEEAKSIEHLWFVLWCVAPKYETSKLLLRSCTWTYNACWQRLSICSNSPGGWRIEYWCVGSTHSRNFFVRRFSVVKCYFKGAGSYTSIVSVSNMSLACYFQVAGSKTHHCETQTTLDWISIVNFWNICLPLSAFPTQVKPGVNKRNMLLWTVVRNRRL